MEGNSIQDFKSWVLLALFVCRCISAGKSLHPLSEVCWQTKIVVITFKTNCSKCSSSVAGFGLYSIYKSIFLRITQVDFDCNRLLYQMGGSYPY